VVERLVGMGWVIKAAEDKKMNVNLPLHMADRPAKIDLFDAFVMWLRL
jgi:hypothetical protein